MDDAPADSAELAGLFDLRERVAFVPGGYGGIGEAIALGLAQAGARVAVAGRSAEKAQSLAARLREHGGHDAVGFAMDAHSVADIRRCVDAVAERFGRIDMLVNCVGMQREQRLADVTEEAFDEVVQVNLKAAMFLAQAAARHQSAAGARGRRCTCCRCARSSGCATAAIRRTAPAKGALAMLVKQHAVELARARHHRQRRRADRRQQRDGAPLARRTRRCWAGCSSAFRSAVSPSRRTWSARRCSSAARRRRSSPGRSLYVDGGLTATQ